MPAESLRASQVNQACLIRTGKCNQCLSSRFHAQWGAPFIMEEFNRFPLSQRCSLLIEKVGAMRWATTCQPAETGDQVARMVKHGTLTIQF